MELGTKSCTKIQKERLVALLNECHPEQSHMVARLCSLVSTVISASRIRKRKETHFQYVPSVVRPNQ